MAKKLANTTPNSAYIHIGQSVFNNISYDDFELQPNENSKPADDMPSNGVHLRTHFLIAKRNNIYRMPRLFKNFDLKDIRESNMKNQSNYKAYLTTMIETKKIFIFNPKNKTKISSIDVTDDYYETKLDSKSAKQYFVYEKPFYLCQNRKLIDLVFENKKMVENIRNVIFTSSMFGIENNNDEDFFSQVEFVNTKVYQQLTAKEKEKLLKKNPKLRSQNTTITNNNKNVIPLEEFESTAIADRENKSAIADTAAKNENDENNNLGSSTLHKRKVSIRKTNPDNDDDDNVHFDNNNDNEEEEDKSSNNYNNSKSKREKDIEKQENEKNVQSKSSNLFSPKNLIANFKQSLVNRVFKIGDIQALYFLTKNQKKQAKKENTKNVFHYFVVDKCFSIGWKKV